MSVFPILDTIDPMLKAVEGRPEFHVNERHEYGIGVIMYNIVIENTFSDPNKAETEEDRLMCLLRREGRGIVYDLETRRILSRPYHKFFNVNERDETQADAIDWTKPHVVLEKLDGSMLTPLVREDSIHLMTKRGVTPISMNAQHLLEEKPHYVKFIRYLDTQGLTPIFEWCSRRQRIIIDYPEERLVLTAVRDRVTGEYMRYADMVSLANSYGVDVVRAIDSTVTDASAFLEQVRQLKAEEGYVVRFEDGSMYKIKGEWYCSIHRILENLSFEKDVIQLILTGAIDDAKPFLFKEMADSINQFETEIYAGIRQTASDVFRHATTARDKLNASKKAYAASVTSDKSLALITRWLFYVFDRPECTESDLFNKLVETVLDHTTSATRVEQIRHIMGGAKWKDPRVAVKTETD